MLAKYSIKGKLSRAYLNKKKWLKGHRGSIALGAGLVAGPKIEAAWHESQRERAQEHFARKPKSDRQRIAAIEKRLGATNPAAVPKVKGFNANFRQSSGIGVGTKAKVALPLVDRAGQLIGGGARAALNLGTRLPGAMVLGATAALIGRHLMGMAEKHQRTSPGGPIIRMDVEGQGYKDLRQLQKYVLKACTECEDTELYGIQEQLKGAMGKLGGGIQAGTRRVKSTAKNLSVGFLIGMIASELLGRGVGASRWVAEAREARYPQQYKRFTGPKVRGVPLGTHEILKAEADSMLRKDKVRRMRRTRKIRNVGIGVGAAGAGGYLGKEALEDYAWPAAVGAASRLAMGLGRKKALTAKLSRGKQAWGSFKKKFPKTASGLGKVWKASKENPLYPIIGASVIAPSVLPMRTQKVEHTYTN